MAEDVARAIGAGGKTVVIAGKECQIRPLSLLELTELERECLRTYKKDYLETFKDNADLLGDDAPQFLRDKLEEVARWDVTNLPMKYVYDPSKLAASTKLKLWLKKNTDFNEKPSGEKLEPQLVDRIMQRMAATCLDNGTLSEDKYQQLTGKETEKTRVGYVNWWITGAMDGMITMIWICFRSYGVTKEEVAREFTKLSDVLVDMARDIEHLTAPEVGNG